MRKYSIIIRDLPNFLVFLTLLCASNSYALEGYPSAGQYHINTESVITKNAGSVVLTTKQTVDGATGDTTVVRSSSIDTKPAITKIKGTKPNATCRSKQSITHAPISAACSTLASGASSANPAWHADCSIGSLDSVWKKVDDKTWEHKFTRVPSSATGTPAPAATQSAMAPILAKMEAELKTSTPEEASSLQNSIHVLKAQLGGQNDEIGKVSITELWIKIADSCPN
jgi:hypothetical protein